jgi:hypothetical protein
MSWIVHIFKPVIVAISIATGAHPFHDSWRNSVVTSISRLLKKFSCDLHFTTLEEIQLWPDNVLWAKAWRFSSSISMSMILSNHFNRRGKVVTPAL